MVLYNYRKNTYSLEWTTFMRLDYWLRLEQAKIDGLGVFFISLI